ncbi:RebB family R body protein [Magnetovibrio sp. PR-2]|uniref:RebB family R body protein n=1 Tax=Magnetovibrio sp. PR-2 TaxID=3120356 RepID=UPI002FCE425B
MADLVHSQITDAVTQTNVKVLGESPTGALGVSSQAMSHAMGLAMENATQTQGGMQQIGNSAAAALMSMITKAGAS